MNKKFIHVFFCILCILYSSLVALEKSIEEIEKDAYQKLEKGLEQAGLGLVETGIGVHRFSHGDPISGCRREKFERFDRIFHGSEKII